MHAASRRRRYSPLNVSAVTGDLIRPLFAGDRVTVNADPSTLFTNRDALDLRILGRWPQDQVPPGFPLAFGAFAYGATREGDDRVVLFFCPASAPRADDAVQAFALQYDIQIQIIWTSVTDSTLYVMRPRGAHFTSNDELAMCISAFAKEREYARNMTEDERLKRVSRLEVEHDDIIALASASAASAADAATTSLPDYQSRPSRPSRSRSRSRKNQRIISPNDRLRQLNIECLERYQEIEAECASQKNGLELDVRRLQKENSALELQLRQLINGAPTTAFHEKTRHKGKTRSVMKKRMRNGQTKWVTRRRKKSAPRKEK